MTGDFDCCLAGHGEAAVSSPAPAPARRDYEFTLEDIAAGGSQRQAVEEALADLVDRLDNGETYDDVLDRLEGPWLVDGEWCRLLLPGQTDDPVYVRLLGIARRIRRETRQ